MKRLITIISLFVVTALIAASCSSSSNNNDPASQAPESTKAAETGASGTNKKLVVMRGNFSNDVQKHQWDLIAEDFESKNPGVDVEITPSDVRVDSGKLTTLLNSGVEPPDVIMINGGPGWIDILAKAKLIMPLNDMYAANNWQDKLLPSAYGLASSSGTIYEVPHMLDTIEVYYNKEIFENAGVSVPTTSDQFMEVMQKLKDSGVVPLTVGARDGFNVGWLVGNILETVAGTQKVEDVMYGKGKWNDPEFVKAAEMIKEWVNKGFIPKEAVSQSSADATALLTNSKAAMMVSGAWTISDVVASDMQDKIGVFTMPSFVEGEVSNPTGGIGLTWVVPAKAKDPELTAKFLDYVLTDLAGVLMTEPTYDEVLASKAAVSITPPGLILQQILKDVEGGSGFNPSLYLGPATKEAYFQNFQGIVGGLVSPQDAMNNIEAGAQKDRDDGFELTKAAE
ncbi:ABC transporter substrate-binding protein [Cohnella cellulosilytica]|uniref:ABC transporter substrate-binding protein n=1 Tax=Cohnella cellulosilytica TaxID=986710 RepID=A0ABW2F3M8_9BACL